MSGQGWSDFRHTISLEGHRHLVLERPSISGMADRNLVRVITPAGNVAGGAASEAARTLAGTFL